MKITIETEPRLEKITDEMFPFFTKYIEEIDEVTIWYFFKEKNKYYATEIGCNGTLSEYITIDELVDDLDMPSNVVIKEVIFK